MNMEVMKSDSRRTLCILSNIFSKYPDRLACCDLQRQITYKELDEESGKIYSYLRRMGIGKEDTVQLIMPRSVGMYSCILGVLKAGAAFTPFEDTYPKERLKYIEKDCNAKLVMTYELYQSIIVTENYLEGYESTNLHDAAYIIYTSGSTGDPKGVMHEYGNIDQLSSIHPLRETYSECRYGLIAPFYFAAGIEFSLVYLLEAGTIYIVPREMVRDIRTLSAFIEEKKIQKLFLSPSYIRLYKNPSPYLEEILTAGEPANGIYYEGGKPIVRNQLGMSECGFPLLTMILDKRYEIAPVGKPILDVDVHIVDEDGNRIEGAGQGELCFKNEYIRGYVNLPEKTAKVFRNGYFHTGDLVSRDEEGRYYVRGRIDDMFKINGNRIEPAEIEAGVKDITGLKNVVAKGFQIGNRSFIVVYFLKNQAAELGIYSEDKFSCDMSKLKEILPDYMQPSYYVGLDEFPMNLNGKLNKKELKAPDISQYHSDYIAPLNDAEKFICLVMEKVLEIDRVGVNDDFYQIGGDSLKTIEFIGECADVGCTISSSDMYEYRTPGALAGHIDQSFEFQKALTMYENHKKNVSNVECRFEDGKISYYGSCFGWVKGMVFDKKYYICDDFYFKDAIDPDRMQAALDSTLELCPYPGYIVDYPKGDWRICLRKGNGPIRILPLSDEKTIGSSWKNRKSCYVLYEGKHLRIYLSHAVTDGQGSARFNNLLLAHYFNQPHDADSFENARDYAADILDKRYTVSDGFVPIKHKRDGFKIKEVKPLLSAFENHKIVVKKTKVEALCNEYGVSLFTLTTVLLALAIMKVHPENKKDIIIRTPINTRGYFNCPNTFQNASMPHIFIRIGVDLLNKDMKEILDETTKQMHEQLSKDNISYLTNRYYDALQKRSPFALIKVILKDLVITDLYVSDFVNMSIDKNIQCQLESTNSNFNLFGLMLTTDSWQDDIIFNLGQRFKSDAYVNALKELL